MIAAATLQRLVEGPWGRLKKKGIGGVDGEKKMTRRGVRCCSALSGSGYHRYGAYPKYRKYIVGLTAGTTFLQTRHDN
jgi:hypothetical protein